MNARPLTRTAAALAVALSLVAPASGQSEFWQQRRSMGSKPAIPAHNDRLAQELGRVLPP